MSLSSLRLRPRAVAATGLVVAITAAGAAALIAPSAVASTKTTTKTYTCFTKPTSQDPSNTFSLTTTKNFTQPDSVNAGSSFRVQIGGYTLTPDTAGANILRSSTAVAGTPGPYTEDIASVNGSSGVFRIGNRPTGTTGVPGSTPATIITEQQSIAGSGPLTLTGAGQSNPITPATAGSLDLIEPASFFFRLNRSTANGTALEAAILQCDTRGTAIYGTITVNPAGTATTTTAPPTTTVAPTTTVTPTTTVAPTTTITPTTTKPPTTTVTPTTTVAPTTTITPTTTKPPTTTGVPTTTVPPTTTGVPTTTVPPTTTAPTATTVVPTTTVAPTTTAPATSTSTTPTTVPTTSTSTTPTSSAPAPTAGVRLSATTVVQGDSLTATGFGFAPGASVTGRALSTPVDLGTVVAGADGTAAFTVSTATLDPGRHTVELTSGTTVLTADFTVTAPTAGSGDVTSSGGTGSGQYGSGPVSNGPSGQSPLALTGSNAVVPLSVAGVLLVSLGAGVVVAGRRRRATD